MAETGYCAWCGRETTIEDGRFEQDNVFVCGDCAQERDRDFEGCYWEEYGNA